MDNIEYRKWEEERVALLLNDGETKEFVFFVMQWIKSITGNKEILLLEEYHPFCIGFSENQIFEFITIARFLPAELSNTEFRIQKMDSALFLYKPLLKLKFIKEGGQ